MANYFEGISVWNSEEQGVGGNGVYIGPPDKQGLASRAAISILSHADTIFRDSVVYGAAGNGIVVVDDGLARVELEDIISTNNTRDGVKIKLGRKERRRIQSIEMKGKIIPIEVGGAITNNNGRDGTHISGDLNLKIRDVQSSGNGRDGVRITGGSEGQEKGYWIKTVLAGIIAAVVAGIILAIL